jgi:hypothetical protein
MYKQKALVMKTFNAKPFPETDEDRLHLISVIIIFFYKFDNSQTVFRKDSFSYCTFT